jgi:hypothetical protein
MQMIDTIAIGLGGSTKKLAEINKYIDDIEAQLSPEDFDKFMANFNAIDISNLDSWEGLAETLEDVGLGAITTSESFQDLIKDGSAAANAIKKVDLEGFTETLKSLQVVISEINSGD